MSGGARPFLKKKSADKSGDLRAVALSAHNKAQDVWGKKKAAGANNVLDQIEPENVEAYSLDFAIRKLWELQRDGNELVHCTVPIDTTKKLRAIVLEVLNEHQDRLTHEHTFDIADPEVVEQREKEKRERAIANMKERQARREEVEREKRERQAKMIAQQEEKKRLEEEEQQKEKDKQNDAGAEDEEGDGEKVEKKSRKKKKSKDGSSRKRSKKDKDGADGGEKEKTKKRKKKSGSRVKLEGDDEKKKEKRRRKTSSDVEVTNGSVKKETPEEEKTKPAPDAADDSAKASARNRRRTVGTAPRGRPVLRRGGDVVVQEEPIPTISVKKTLVDLDALHTILEERIRTEFPNPMEPPAPDNEFLDFYHLSVKGPRPSNEDEYCVIEHVNEWFNLPEGSDKYAYFGVYDGHSGKYTSLYTRSQLHKNLFMHSNYPDDEAFISAFNETDRCVNEFQHRNTFSCGTTALSVSIKNNKELIVGNVGDCRGFLCRDGRPYEIAVPHNLDREDEKKRIESLGGAVVCFGTWRVNGILAVSRSIGDYNLRALVISDPEVTRIELQKSDEFLVVASDGLWDGCTGEEMIQIVKRVVAENGREHVCKALCDTGIEKNTKDNVTVVAVFFNQDKAP